jgi:myo-inositol-1(or 4)-monophosphatase
MNSQTDLPYMTFVAIQAALQAGDILRKGFGSIYEITNKPGKQNIVTQYDKASEEAIISFIQHHFPKHSFLAEERGLFREQEDSILWIIDPLDGTTNFARHLPFFTISIAAYYQEEGLCGVIFQPLTNELFIVEKNKGAYLNGVRLSVSTTERVGDSVIGAGFPYNVVENPQNGVIDHMSRFIQQGAILRNLGSAALTLAYVAAGKLDGFWMDNLFPWDLAAGKLLIKEAGGKVTRYDGLSHQITVPSSVLATNQMIHQEMLHYLTHK